MSIRGAYRDNGSWVGFDYSRQAWIDTNPAASRDTKYSAGSACNPLAKRPTCPVCGDTACETNDDTCGT